jgi:hypothetical protein
VVFVAGAKLLDSVKPPETALATGSYPALPRRRNVAPRHGPTRVSRRSNFGRRISARSE